MKLRSILTSSLVATASCFAPLLPPPPLLSNTNTHASTTTVTPPFFVMNQNKISFKMTTTTTTRRTTFLKISTGLTFSDEEQILVSTQKPLGIILEEVKVENDNDESIGSGISGGCFVADVIKEGNAYQGGVRIGDILVAVQNMDVSQSSLEDVMERIGNAPRVVNLRFLRGDAW
uniref:PDZ domain-containing protein n=1 Tax=Ditylum brightwellii TaxID=49249 RepID=A0A6U3Y1Q3_9STRA|mmetsp:Transcript_28833/g.42859  ORF Transcript_28833/g.42859 Transcript_28833/m.42859 type:complete len:175 (+) Transcript_28833:295-819(+)